MKQEIIKSKAEEKNTIVGFFKVRDGFKEKGKFIAWATLIPMTNAGPIEEPADPLWFEFGKTSEESVLKLKSEVEKETGVTEWIQQKI